jgi:Protein of unknown function (DUF2630)
MDDHDVLQHISELVAEEHRLRSGVSQGHPLDEESRARVAHLEVQLDQCWDLLRRRQAREEFGQDPDAETTRDDAVVEGYQQ